MLQTDSYKTYDDGKSIIAIQVSYKVYFSHYFLHLKISYVIY